MATTRAFGDPDFTPDNLDLFSKLEVGADKKATADEKGKNRVRTRIGPKDLFLWVSPLLLEKVSGCREAPRISSLTGDCVALGPLDWSFDSPYLAISRYRHRSTGKPKRRFAVSRIAQ